MKKIDISNSEWDDEWGELEHQLESLQSQLSKAKDMLTDAQLMELDNE